MKTKESESWRLKYLQLEKRLLDVEEMQAKLNEISNKLFEREKEVDRLKHEKAGLLQRIEVHKEKERSLHMELERLAGLEHRVRSLELENSGIKQQLEEAREDIETWKHKYMESERRAAAKNQEEALRLLREELERLKLELDLRTRERDSSRG
jgi:chromosome segregation ATPase